MGMKRIRPSVLHRLMGIVPGYAPGWICSKSMCGDGSLDALDIGLLLLVLGLWPLGRLASLAFGGDRFGGLDRSAAVGIAVVYGVLAFRFRSVEHKGRVAIRIAKEQSNRAQENQPV
jgi:hypothetical protein